MINIPFTHHIMNGKQQYIHASGIAYLNANDIQQIAKDQYGIAAYTNKLLSNVHTINMLTRMVLLNCQFYTFWISIDSLLTYNNLASGTHM